MYLSLCIQPDRQVTSNERIQIKQNLDNNFLLVKKEGVFLLSVT